MSKVTDFIKGVKFTWNDLVEYGFVMLGSVFLAAAFVLFITPYNITPGGVYGLGVALREVFGLFEVGTWGFILDIPLMLMAFIFLGAGLGVKTVFAAVLLPIVMNLMTYYVGSVPAEMLGGAIDLSNDRLLSCIFGGVLMGVGMGLIFRSGATSGGTDIVAMFVSKFLKLPLAKSVLLVDSLVIIVGLVVFGDWLLPLYALVTLFVATKLMDFILEGGSDDKMVLVMSEEQEKIRDFVLGEMKRGGTFIKSQGMYTHSDKEMIFVMISRKEIIPFKNYVHSVDPNAFMVVVNAHETLGEGFKMLEKQ